MPKVVFEQKMDDGTIFMRRQMDNGEFRDSIKGPDGSSYIRTSMPATAKGEWQNSHYHGGARESIVVIKGWMGGAELLPDGSRVVKVYRTDEQFFTTPGIAHNFYMPAGAVTHCDKYGTDVGNPDEQRKGADWWPAPADFDAWTKSLSEADIFRLAGLSQDEIKALAA